MPASELAVATFALLGLFAAALLASGLLGSLGTLARVTSVDSSLAEFFFDAEEAVVLANAVRTREGTRLDLASGSTDGDNVLLPEFKTRALETLAMRRFQRLRRKYF